MRSLRRMILATSCLAVGSLVALGQGPALQSVGSPTFNTVSGPGESAQPISQPRKTAAYVAVIGHVREPGVYELDPAQRQLDRMLTTAGGLDPQASGSIRVVSEGRPGGQVFVDAKRPRSSQELSAGDVLVVEGFNSRLPHTPRSAAEARAMIEHRRSALMQIAIVNLIDRPVVLPVWEGRATTRQLLSTLGQPPELISNADVVSVPTAALQRRLNGQQLIDQMLLPGDVIVLPAGMSRPESVPFKLPLPKNQLHPDPEPVAEHQVPAPLPVDDSAAASTITDASETGLPAVESLQPPADEGLTEVQSWQQADQTTNSARVAAEDDQSESVSAGENNESGSVPVAAAGSGATPDAESAAAIAAASPTTSPALKTGSAWTRKMHFAIAYAAIVAIGLVLYLMWNMYRASAAQDRAEMERLELPPPDPFEELLHNRLPLIDRPMVMPANLMIQGRRPDVEPQRIDGPQALQGPHFPTAEKPGRTPEVPAAGVSREWASTAASSLSASSAVIEKRTAGAAPTSEELLQGADADASEDTIQDAAPRKSGVVWRIDKSHSRIEPSQPDASAKRPERSRSAKGVVESIPVPAGRGGQRRKDGTDASPDEPSIAPAAPADAASGESSGQASNPQVIQLRRSSTTHRIDRGVVGSHRQDPPAKADQTSDSPTTDSQTGVAAGAAGLLDRVLASVKGRVS